jgi:hypothetical protein
MVGANVISSTVVGNFRRVEGCDLMASGDYWMLRRMLGLVLCASSAVVFAQAQSEPARAAAGCGPSQTQFEVKTDKKAHAITAADPGKALVYVVENERRDNEAFHVGAVTIRVGLDGKWVGANHGASYFFFTVDPGEHRVCTDWQSSLSTLSKLGSAITFTAESGKTYYLQVEVEERKEHPARVKLEAIDPAQGQLLISTHSLSRPRAR